MRQFILTAILCCVSAHPCLAQNMSAMEKTMTFQRGLTAVKEGNNAGAITDFSRLLKSEPGNGEYYALRGAAYSGAGKHALAAADFESAMRNGENTAKVKDNYNSATASMLAPPVASAGKTVQQIADLGKRAIDGKDYKTALGYYNVLASQSNPQVRKAGLCTRAICFLVLGKKVNARFDAEMLKSEGVNNEVVQNVLKATSGATVVAPAVVKTSPVKVAPVKDVPVVSSPVTPAPAKLSVRNAFIDTKPKSEAVKPAQKTNDFLKRW